ncbi:uncharacterized protein BT62DRAFT_993424 [Guyanagaster necrorhizus]|uniref:Uncharacterized protein n=1 Tax=Guyanagaster necrorhizus TaxID=856835 RepID=A0A9P7VXX4_9AGAR|nr:uncharacterized protein BT62DRAFT_993424 [Guyanagaster necrorhizus MCA 3950]KAG7447851.1 hypothetical protein BT62DRAFT_993424 [Guyanagaster necrorhizus MCA 3950]
MSELGVGGKDGDDEMVPLSDPRWKTVVGKLIPEKVIRDRLADATSGWKMKVRVIPVVFLIINGLAMDNGDFINVLIATPSANNWAAFSQKGCLDGISLYNFVFFLTSFRATQEEVKRHYETQELN